MAGKSSMHFAACSSTAIGFPGLQALKALQDYAKDWSQENTVTIVFVCGAETPLQGGGC